jgi:hypothetical protein
MLTSLFGMECEDMTVAGLGQFGWFISGLYKIPYNLRQPLLLSE